MDQIAGQDRHRFVVGQIHDGGDSRIGQSLWISGIAAIPQPQ